MTDIRDTIAMNKDACIHSRRVMKPYTETCKPEKPGWYWAKFGFDRVPDVYEWQGDGFYLDNEKLRSAPEYWHELEDAPEMPKRDDA